jgi:Glyoxalase/Bleomycin resistance protein/Dioxygenase superfamily
MTVRPHFQVGIAVPDLERAMTELSEGLGVEWCEPQERRPEGFVNRVTFTKAEPFIELIEGAPGSPWDASEGAYLHHLGFWTDDLAGAQERVMAAGMAMERSGEAPFGGGWSYHFGPASGLRVELCDLVSRDGFLATWNLPGGSAPAV